MPATVLAQSLFARFKSRQDDSYSMKVAAALRNQFGGHAVKKMSQLRRAVGGERVTVTLANPLREASDRRTPRTGVPSSSSARRAI